MNKKVAVVTGAASGLGKAIATAMGQRGDCHLIVLDKSPSVAQFAQSLGPSVEPYLCDLEDPAQIIAFGQHVRSAHGRCDILINNAGIHPKNPDNSKVALEDITLATWNAVLAVNLTAPFLMCQQLLPLMREHRWGRIVNISSRAGRTLIPNVVAAYYSATKAALMGLTRTVAEEGAPFNVTVNTVAVLDTTE